MVSWRPRAISTAVRAAGSTRASCPMRPIEPPLPRERRAIATCAMRRQPWTPGRWPQHPSRLPRAHWRRRASGSAPCARPSLQKTRPRRSRPRLPKAPFACARPSRPICAARAGWKWTRRASWWAPARSCSTPCWCSSSAAMRPMRWRTRDTCASRASTRRAAALYGTSRSTRRARAFASLSPRTWTCCILCPRTSSPRDALPAWRAATACFPGPLQSRGAT